MVDANAAKGLTERARCHRMRLDACAWDVMQTLTVHVKIASVNNVTNCRYTATLRSFR